MMPVDRFLEAERHVRPYVRETPLLFSGRLSERCGARLYLKLENLQHTGSFKARGAMRKVLALSGEQRGRGVVTASTGNHGAATAHAGRQVGVDVTVMVPHGASPSKVERIRKLGATVEFFGGDSAKTEMRAREIAAERGLLFISPYNDDEVIAGQGTVGVELLRQCPDLDAVVVAVGGGGLIGGIASYLKGSRPGIQVLGCSPVNSAVMVESVRQGKILDLPSLPTLSDGTAGGVEPGAITFELCRTLVDDYDLVSESEIEDAMRLAFEDERLIIEGSAGVAIASALRQAARWPDRRVAVVICGGNIGSAEWAAVMEAGSGKREMGSGKWEVGSGRGDPK